MVFCSTDKAAQQLSTMGASKRFLEIMGQNIVSKFTKYVSVRFGNILYSSGSLTQVIDRMALESSPVVIRNDKMTRYVITKSDVSALIDYAVFSGDHGDICAIQSPTVNVLDLAVVYMEMIQAQNSTCIVGKNVLNEAINESLFNEREVINVKKSGKFYIYNRSNESNINDRERDYLLSSAPDTMNRLEIKKYLWNAKEVY